MKKYADWIFPFLAFFVLCFLFDDVVRNLGLSISSDDNLQIQFPFYAYFIDSVQKTGSLDSWNPYIWGGVPAIGNPSVPLSIVQIAFFYLGKTGFIRAMNWHLFLEFWAAAVGCYFLCQSLGRSKIVAAFAALAYIFSSSASILMYEYGTFFHCAVIPWTLLILRTVHCRRWTRSLLYLVPLFYLQFTYGMPQWTLYSGILYLLWISWIDRERGRTRERMAVLFSAGAVALVLSAHYLLPMIEFLKTYPDRSASDLGLYIRQNMTPWQYTLALFFPEAFWCGFTNTVETHWWDICWWPVWHVGWNLLEGVNVGLGLVFTPLWILGCIRGISYSSNCSLSESSFLSSALRGKCFVNEAAISSIAWINPSPGFPSLKP